MRELPKIGKEGATAYQLRNRARVQRELDAAATAFLAEHRSAMNGTPPDPPGIPLKPARRDYPAETD